MNNIQLTKTLLSLVQSGKINKNTAYELLQAYNYNTAESPQTEENDSIAIIGMACCFPGANDTKEFWHNLSLGVDSVGVFPTSRRKDTDGLLKGQLSAQPNPYYQGGYLSEISLFDHEFFHIDKEEADFMDPQHRIFLETVQTALEDAGYSGIGNEPRNVGVFVGNSESEYHKFIKRGSSIAITGNASAFLCGRVSFIYNFTGPSMMVNTACSSSLVAVHLACQALSRGECDTALAGGITLFTLPVNDEFDVWKTVGISSPDNKCKVFDDLASGAVRGEGAGAVVLKPLKKAIEDRDYIYAVIKGTAINQDGHSNGLTSPNPLAQASVIKKAWERGKVDPQTIGYIETHGTGTRLGDPVEVAGLTMAFEKYTKRKQFCAIGSLKSNIGHLSDGAAGVAGLIKVVLMIQEQKLPPSLHFTYPNSLIPFVNSPLYVNTQLRKWHSHGNLRQAGVSAFGLMGTNCHIVLEEYQREAGPPSSSESTLILYVSARSKIALIENVKRLIKFVENGSERLEDICYTANSGRGNNKFKLAFVFQNKRELCEQMQSFLNENFNNHIHGTGIYTSEMETEKDAQSVDIRGMSAHTIAKLCMQSSPIDWRLFYKDQQVYRLPITSYTFERVRCWAEETPAWQKYSSTGNTKCKEKSRNFLENKVGEDLSGDFLSFCSHMLERDNIALNNDFFQLGGTSIKIVEFIEEIGHRYGVQLSIGDIYKTPVLKDILKLINSSKVMEGETVKEVEKTNTFPLSTAQKRIYFMQQLIPDSIVYNLSGVVQLIGTLDMDRFTNSIQSLVKHHEALRMSFTMHGRQPIQVICDDLDFQIQFRDMSVVESDINVNQTIKSFITPFDLSKTPLLRVGLIKIRYDEHYMIFDMHHIVSDGTSLGLLMKHFVNLYNNNTLPNKKATYLDYVNSQNLIDENEICRQKKFWHEMFAGRSFELQLPYDFERGVDVDYAGETFRGKIEKSLFYSIQQNSRAHNTTSYMILLAGLNLLLVKYAKQEDIVIGIMSDGRTQLKYRDVIGMFVNTLPICNQPTAHKTVFDFICEVHKSVADALENQDYQFNDLINDLKLALPLNRNPLFDVAFVMQNMDYSSFILDGLEVKPILTDTKTAQFDIRFEAWEEENCIRLNIEYKTSLFKNNTIYELYVDYIEIITQMMSCNTNTIYISDILNGVHESNEGRRPCI